MAQVYMNFLGEGSSGKFDVGAHSCNEYFYIGLEIGKNHRYGAPYATSINKCEHFITNFQWPRARDVIVYGGIWRYTCNILLLEDQL